jgi:hypothetical protein
LQALQENDERGLQEIGHDRFFFCQTGSFANFLSSEVLLIHVISHTRMTQITDFLPLSILWGSCGRDYIYKFVVDKANLKERTVFFFIAFFH